MKFGLQDPSILCHLLMDLHWEGCKVKASKPHAWNLAKDSLSRGINEAELYNLYLEYLRKWHAIATDNAKIFEYPSGLISEIRKELEL